jgi:hypothetical protein
LRRIPPQMDTRSHTGTRLATTVSAMKRAWESSMSVAELGPVDYLTNKVFREPFEEIKQIVKPIIDG